ncbi:MAG: hypothetical protein ACQEWF_07745 [Bacillota bacterium]
MIETVELQADKVFEGLDISVNNLTFAIANGTYDGIPLSSISFDLVSDSIFSVQNDLYIVRNGDVYEYYLDVTYIDDVNIAVYEGEYPLMHTYIAVLVKPDGNVEGQITRLIPRMKSEDIGYEEDKAEPHKE